MTLQTRVFQLLKIASWSRTRESTSKRGPVISLSRALYTFTGKCQEGRCLPSRQSYQATGRSIYSRLSLLNRSQVLKWISSSYSSTTTYYFVVCGERYLISRDVPVVRKRRGQDASQPRAWSPGSVYPTNTFCRARKTFLERQLQTNRCAQEQGSQV